MPELEHPNTATSYARLINQLGSFFKSRRDRAYAALQAASVEAVRPLLLRRLTTDVPRTTRRWILTPLVIVLGLNTLVSYTTRSIHHSNYYRFRSAKSDEEREMRQSRVDDEIDFRDDFLWLGMLGAYGAYYGSYLRRYRRTWLAASLLSLNDDPVIVGPLTELLYKTQSESMEDVSTNYYTPVRAAWVRMLPKVTPDIASTINIRQRRILRSALHKAVDPAPIGVDRCRTAIAIMQCLAVIGDQEARPTVEKVSKWKRVGQEQAVSAQARECLRLLDSLKEQGRSGSVLLRGSSNPRTQAEILLRGANESAVVDAAELLRADQTPIVEEAPVFVAKPYSVKQETEEVLESKVGGG